MMESSVVYSLGAPDWRGLVVVAALLLLPIVLLVFLTKGAGAPTIRILVPAVSVVCLALLAGIVWHAAGVKATVSERALVLGVGLYRLDVPLDTLRVEDAVVDPIDLSLRLRTNGIGLPGLALGWFRASDGKPAFAAVSGSGERVWIPLEDGRWVVASPRSPTEFLADVKSRRGQTSQP